MVVLGEAAFLPVFRDDEAVQEEEGGKENDEGSSYGGQEVLRFEVFLDVELGKGVEEDDHIGQDEKADIDS